ncbi:cytochrome P450 [Streptomyces sp. JNUCC 63]
MLLGGGSDPEVFPNPARMRPHRTNIRRRPAFGVGRHRCTGAFLARTEAAVALRTAASCLSGVRLEGDRTEPPVLGLFSFRAPLCVTLHR